MIQLSNISKYYPTRQGQLCALENINLNVKAGEIFGSLVKAAQEKALSFAASIC